MGFSYRCGRDSCRKRHTFPQPVQAYLRRPRGCRRGIGGWVCACGGTLHSTDAALRRAYRQQDTCRCGMPHWPHRQGSTVECEAHPDFDPFGD